MKTSDDAGGGSVIWSNKQYIDKTHRPLNDMEFNVLLSCNALQLKAKLINISASALLNKWLLGIECGLRPFICFARPKQSMRENLC